MGTTGRTLQTACSVLQVLRLLSQRPGGVTACEVGQLLSKSAATATYLLNSLCQEGYAERAEGAGRYKLHRLVDDTVLPEPAVRAPASSLKDSDVARMLDAVEELYRYTGHRAYLTSVHHNALVIEEVKGRQGLPAIHGLGPRIGKEAHGLAIGKAVLSTMGEAAIDAYIDAFGLMPYTPNTIIDREALRRELEDVRRKGYAVDEEEYEEGFVCIAAPLHGADGELTGAIGLSTSPTRFMQEAPWLIQALTDVVGVTGAPPPQATDDPFAERRTGRAAGAA
jgi:DNA-binding IclR family transcriptional regulator